MDYYLSFNNNEERIRLPVIPSSFEVSIPHQNTTVNITNLGEINLIGKTGLMNMSIESFFPCQQYSFCLYKDFQKPTSTSNNYLSGRIQASLLGWL